MPPWNELIQKFLDGTITPAEFRELDHYLCSDPLAADAFTRANRMDAALENAFTDSRPIEPRDVFARRMQDEEHTADDYLPVMPRRRKMPWRAMTLAVGLLLATGVAIYWNWADRTNLQITVARDHQLISGVALVDGERDRPIRDGSIVEALDEAAVLSLKDGSLVELAPASLVVVRGADGDVRQAINLLRGSGTFHVEKGQRRFRVETPLGNIAVLGTAFEVRLQPLELEGDDPMPMRAFLTLAVLVTAGHVEVEHAGKTWSLTAGQSQVFADEREKPKSDPVGFDRKADMTGRLVSYDAKAGTLVATVVRERETQRVTFAVAKDAKVFLADNTAGKFSDLTDTQSLGLFLNEDKSTILAIRVEGRTVERPDPRTERRLYLVQSVDVEKKTITFRAERQNLTFTVADDARIFISGKEAKLADVKPNVQCQLQMSADQKSIVVLRQGEREGDGERPIRRDPIGGRPSLYGYVAEHDEKAGTIVVLQRTDGGEKRNTFNLSKELKISVSGQPGKLSDLTARTLAGFYLNDASTTVISISVESRPQRRLVQSVDVEKSTIAFKAEGRELVFPVAKDAKITVDNKEAKLEDVKPDVACQVMMSADGKTVVSIVVGRGRRDGDK